MPDADNTSIKAIEPWWRWFAATLARLLVWSLAAALSLGWFFFAFLLGGGEGDNVTCGCWADHPSIRVGLMEIFVAALGGLALTTASALWFKYRRAALIGVALFVAAAVVWVVIFYLPSRHMVGH
jgi:hypothetical protein